MKLTCQRSALATAFQTVAGIVPARTPKPILQNIKLQATMEGATLVATDSEVGIRYRVGEATVDAPGELLLPKNKTNDILREMVGDTVTLEKTDDVLWIRGDRAEYRLGSEDPVEFPNVSGFDANEYYILQTGALKQMIRRTLFACDTESTRYALGGVLIDLKGDVATFAATDTRRLAVTKCACAMQGKVEVKNGTPVVPSRAMSLIERSLGDENEPVWIAIDTNHLLLKTAVTTIYTRLVEGRFPKYQDVIPRHATSTIDLVAGPFHMAVRQSLIVTNEESRGVDFRFAPGILTLASQAADVGESKVELPIGYDGPEVSITFDPRYIAEFLKVLTAEQPLKLELTNADNAALFKTEDGYNYVVMPLSRDR